MKPFHPKPFSIFHTSHNGEAQFTTRVCAVATLEEARAVIREQKREDCKRYPFGIAPAPDGAYSIFRAEWTKVE